MSLEEKLEQAKGSVKEGVGELTGDEKIRKRRNCRKSNSKS